MSFVTLPAWADVVGSTTSYAAGMFGTLLGFGLAIIGIVIGALFVNYLLRTLVGATKKITNRGGRGRRGRR